MAEETKIRVIFTEKSDQILSDITRKFNLQTGMVTIDHLAKDFAKGKLLEKDLTASLERDLKVSSQTAEQVAREIITALVPTLKKISEEDLAKLSEAEKDALMYGPAKKTEESVAIPKMRPPIEVEKILAEKQGPTLKEKIKEAPIKKAPAKGSGMPREAERPAPKQPRKSDSYREPIE